MKRALLVTFGLALVATMAMIPMAQASVLPPENFESFNTGSVNGQGSWTITNPNYDVAIADPTQFSVTTMGNRALRISNAVMSGSFGDWLFSPSLTESAGEPSSDGGVFAAPATQRRFDATFDIASADPNAVQPGLQFSVSPDRGDGARMSYLRFEDTLGGIQVTFADYIDAHPLGATLGDPNGCGVEDNFHETVIASGLSRTETHQVHIAMEFLNGPANDRVFVWIDGKLAHVGTSWEDYFRYCEGNQTRPVDSLLFRAGGIGTNPGVAGKGFLIDSVGISSGDIPVDGATGTWSQYPVAGTQYQAQILPPINANGGSNWSSKSKGGIPVMFSLSSGSTAAVFESIGSDTNPANDYAYASFAPGSNLVFGDIQTLMTNYQFTQGNCHGGSLRWSVNTASGNLFIYYGGFPNFTECTSVSQSGANMVGLSDARYDTSQLGGTFYDTYAHALSVMDTKPVTSVSLVLDGGWAGDQRADVSDITVNDSVYQWVAGEASPLAATCDLPAATIAIERLSGASSGAINEAPVQASLSDTGDSFRVVDCKYQYVLSIPSLNGVGSGSYGVEILIGGQPVPTVPEEVGFELR